MFVVSPVAALAQNLRCNTNGSVVIPILNPGNGINTAIGCVPFSNDTTTSDLVGFILRWAIGVGGGIAFLLILYAGFQIMTSSGDPNRLKGGQELLTAAISGLIMLLFSVVLLRIIGVDILKIPGFSN